MTSSRLIYNLIFILFVPLFPAAQKSHDITKLKTQYLKNDTSRFDGGFTVPFSKIEVLDYRFDTSKIGYATYNNRDNHTKFVTRGGTEYYLNKRLNDYFRDNLDPVSAKTLVIVLKKLWLEYGSTNKILRTKEITEQSALSLTNRNAVCLSDIDVFVKTDNSYQALIRLTCNFTIDKTGDFSDCHLLMLPFDSLINNIGKMNIEGTLASKKRFTTEDIHTNYSKRFDIPVLSATHPNRGIYLSFDEFKRNRPSYPDFAFKSFEISTEVTIQSDGKEMPITEYWGFCDGTEVYVKPHYLTFKIVRQGNTFDFLGSLEGRNTPVVIPIPGTVLAIKTNTTLINFIPLQIDMETGKVY